MRDYERCQLIEPPGDDAVELERDPGVFQVRHDRSIDLTGPSATSRHAIDQYVSHERAVLRAVSVSSRRVALRFGFWAIVAALGAMYGPEPAHMALFAVATIGGAAALWYTERAAAYARMSRVPF